jgi:hypothetical protein
MLPHSGSTTTERQRTGIFDEADDVMSMPIRYLENEERGSRQR